MKKKRIYIFNGTARGTEYGIGTYLNQLIDMLKDVSIEFHIVHLYAHGNEANVLEKDGYTQINIPCPPSSLKNAGKYYTQSVVYLLKEFIPENNEAKTIFHLNFMTNEYLVKCLKKQFKCKVILVAHYTNWSFSLFGDYIRLKKIVNKAEKKDATEKAILHSMKEDIKMINSVDRFVCVARHTPDAFSELKNGKTTNAEIINNALKDVYSPLSEEKKGRLRQKYHINKNTQVVLFAGRLDEVKGIAYLIRAFQKVLLNHPNARLFIAGEGNFNAWLKESADIWSKITFTGRLEKEKLYEFYSLADIGIVCSLHEEFGFVAIEMMMHALPLIVTKTGGLDEIVEDNVSGLKVPVRTIKGKRQADVKLLQEKICLLLENPAQASELGENARKRFLEKYELSIFKEKMLNLYQTI